MENSPPIPPDGETLTESRRLGYETSDARLRPIVLFAIVLTVVTVLIHLAVWKYFVVARQQNAREDATPSPFVKDRTPPPEPRLQPSIQHPTVPHEDMEQLHKRWNAALTTYGRVEGEPNRVRIPIDRAMAILVERGLPSTQPSTKPVTNSEGASR